jgi:DNA polymerase (family X)
MKNQEIAAILEGTARLLELQEANPIRVRSYRRAAESLRQRDEPIADIYQQSGEAGLQQLKGVGAKLAPLLREILQTGKLALRDRLESQLSPVTQFCRVPGIGDELAERIHDELGIKTLEQLEQAAHNGRLERLEGIGSKRLQGIQETLAGRLSRSSVPRARQRTKDRQPPVELILELDEEYRRKAEQGELKRIAPQRFNPHHEAWLPIMKQRKDDWDFTCLFSNTKRAHERDKTGDWVVAYYAAGGREKQCTIITAGKGDLKGKRVVRGREAECREYYRRQNLVP